MDLIQISALVIGVLAFLYMFKDQMYKMFSSFFKKKDRETSVKVERSDVDTIKELLDFRSSYAENSIVYLKLTEVIQALLKNE